jgi:NAD+ synthase (glutamine-hydrolysing)
MTSVRVALCQLDTVVGDVEANARNIAQWIDRADATGADLVAFPELAVTGYPPEDLLMKPAFVEDNLAALSEIARHVTECVVLVGFVDLVDHFGGPGEASAPTAPGVADLRTALKGGPRFLRNALAVCHRGEVVGVYHKRLLPNYGVFDEQRWFAPGSEPLRLYEVAGVAVGISICEDVWFDDGPIRAEAAGGAELVVNVNASPFSIGRFEERLAVVGERVDESRCAIAYVNQVGGQDELVFDGGSFVLAKDRSLVACAPQFEEALLVVDVEVEVDRTGAPAAPVTGRELQSTALTGSSRAKGSVAPSSRRRPLSVEEEVYAALVTGTRDYISKNGFSDAVIGLSGGIDSSLVAVIAADALGAEHVHGMTMPSRYSSEGSSADAALLAENLGIDFCTVAIEAAHATFAGLLTPVLGGPPVGLSDENLQSRIRGVLLMAVSNAKGWIVLTTGNKSEIATGYSTLYGDSAGGFAVIKDVPKTLVYRLCRYRNSVAGKAVVPESVLTKAPSAELRPDQRDEDSLPPYEILDPILEALVEEDLSIARVTSKGFDPALVTRVARLVDAAEYKRRQSPPGVRITTKAFGKDRRMPITNRYRDHPATADPKELAASRDGC